MSYVDWAIRFAIASSRAARYLDTYFRPLVSSQFSHGCRNTSNSGKVSILVHRRTSKNRHAMAVVVTAVHFYAESDGSDRNSSMKHVITYCPDLEKVSQITYSSRYVVHLQSNRY
jgi:hypothetical protein